MICKCYGCSELKKVTFQGKLPDNTINCGLQSTCFFFVPKAYYQDYKEALGSKYSYIYVPLNDETSGDQKPVEQCAVPSISYVDGKLTFASSTDAKQYCVASGFDVNVRDIVINAGAEMIVVIAGNIMRMPGLPKVPAAMNMDIVNGQIEGLS